MPTSLLIDDFPVIVVLLIIDDVIVERLKNEPELIVFIERLPYGDESRLLNDELLNAYYK